MRFRGFWGTERCARRSEVNVARGARVETESSCAEKSLCCAAYAPPTARSERNLAMSEGAASKRQGGVAAADVETTLRAWGDLVACLSASQRVNPVCLRVE